MATSATGEKNVWFTALVDRKILLCLALCYLCLISASLTIIVAAAASYNIKVYPKIYAVLIVMIVLGISGVMNSLLLIVGLVKENVKLLQIFLILNAFFALFSFIVELVDLIDVNIIYDKNYLFIDIPALILSMLFSLVLMFLIWLHLRKLKKMEQDLQSHTLSPTEKTALPSQQQDSIPEQQTNEKTSVGTSKTSVGKTATKVSSAKDG